MAELALLLFWPSLVAYSQAALAYAGEAARPGRLARYGIWGVRLGWLAQTALLVAQAYDAGGFAWSTWGATLNLFVWLVVGAYLIWGCRPAYRLLGLAVMPAAAALLGLAWAAGGLDAIGGRDLGNGFLVIHVGAVLVAFAAFALAAAIAAVYLWQEGRLKRRSSTVLRVRAPALATLDLLMARSVAVGFPALLVGVAAGGARLWADGMAPDVLALGALGVVGFYALVLGARHGLGVRGRPFALLAIGGLALVVVVRFGLATLEHF